MSTNSGRLSGSREPSPAVSALAGFDPERMAKSLRDTPEPWLASVVGLDFSQVHALWWEGLIVARYPEARRGDSGRQHWALTRKARIAIATEAAPAAETVELGSVHEGAGPQDIAQEHP